MNAGQIDRKLILFKDRINADYALEITLASNSMHHRIIHFLHQRFQPFPALTSINPVLIFLARSCCALWLVVDILEGNYTCDFNLIYIRFLLAMTEAPAANPEQLNLKVKSQDGEEVFFKIKSTTALKKLMDAYCQRQSLNPGNVRFLFDGERLHEGQTPKELNMENGDEIDVVIEQTGGCDLGLSACHRQ